MGGFLSFGELLIRFTPKQFDVFENNNELEYFFGGSEANIASTLSGFGVETEIFSVLPPNALSSKILRYFKGMGVNMDKIIQKGDKIGYYFVERSAGLRQSNVIYDRKNSAFSQLSTKDVEIASLLKGVSWLHFSGITAAVSESVREVLKLLLVEAKKREVVVSMDLNFRSKMWSPEEAKEFMTALGPYVDLCFGIEPIMLNDQDTKMFPKEKAIKEDVKKRMVDLKEKFGFQYIFHTERKNDEHNNNIYHAYGVGKDIEESIELKTYMTERVGSGDAFVSGVLYSLMENKSLKEALDFGVAAATLKCTIKGDHMSVKAQDVMNLLDKRNSINR